MRSTTKPTNRRRLLRNWPVHVVLIGLCAIWLLPAFGLLITSFRPFQAVNDSGWWTVLSPPKGQAEYQQACASCHGDDGRKIAAADLSSPDLIKNYSRSLTLVAALKKTINGQPHMGTTPIPGDVAAANILAYWRNLSGAVAS